ncbi:methyltransferase domain-containing protein [Streptomyces montanisoli]|uniref:Protein-L-isoaspartate O-methyltransferase n=1 Tax=Streptomyces montanisoli TaxID=2798581 RepID=A0A940MBA0_9ACTN|nr:methyltransferase domain-containing protein [Streptomyces montanisoli]MBP0459764.1 methyltransferase domain-containing protein [Streptomyces montanisoli]
MPTVPDATGGHTALVRSLDERGLLTPRWRAVWQELPRHLFVPDRVWRQGPERCEPVGPAEWWPLVASDEPVVIQVDDGAEGGPAVATSSNSKPSMVARMLGLLELEPAHRVLEIGTASGHVAALLARYLGDDSRVHSIELDPAMARLAAQHLARAGHAPRLRQGDGGRGWPDAAPFDRVVSTCAVRRVPYAWIEQLRPCGRLVLPLHREFWSGAVVRLVRRPDGMAEGRFHGGASYVLLRAQRDGGGDRADVDSSTARASTTDLDPADLLSLGAALYLGARLPGVSLQHAVTGEGVRVWARAADGSAATAAAGEALQYGPRNLWAEIEAEHRAYIREGAPGAEGFGLTVTADAHDVWLHDPGNVIRGN